MEALCVANRFSPANRRFFSLASVQLPGRGVSSSGVALRSRSVVQCCSSFSVESSSPAAVSKEKFMEAASNGNVVPLYTCIFSDHLTPVLAYRCLVKEGDRECPSFLFESVEPGLESSTVGRYSAVGAQPAVEVAAKENDVTVLDHWKGKLTELVVEDPMTVPREISGRWKPQLMDELPPTFCGGWVGFFSYDLARYSEKNLPFSRAPRDDRELPDIHLGLYDDVIVFDHVDKKAYVIHWVQLDQYSSNEEAYNDGLKRLEIFLSKVHNVETPKLPAGAMYMGTWPKFGLSLGESNMTRDEYVKAVVQAKEHILAGNIFQVVLSQRFERRTFADPFEVYRALRVCSPSPHMAYLQARGSIHVASSPEILTKVTKGKIASKPLAGTLRRGNTLQEDLLQERVLLSNEKQRAEHIMLVDLARSDVGKVAKTGSVKVEEIMKVERFSHVMHISSTVTGELQDHLTCWDALSATLPVGTVSGTPKVKAMALIDQLEPVRRGPYSGGLGSVSFSGDMEIALALRTMVFMNGPHFDTMYSYKGEYQRQEWVAHLQAGAGVVADSNPDDEYLECRNKAAGMAQAIELAEFAFVEGHHEEMYENGSVPSHAAKRESILKVEN